MELSLVKGQNVVLAKPGQSVDNIKVGFGWAETGHDLDIFAYMVNKENKGLTDQGVFYFGSADGKGLNPGPLPSDRAGIDRVLAYSPVCITKDNRTGKGEGDDEVLYVNGTLLPQDKKLIIGVNIYNAGRGDNLGQIADVFCRFPGEGEEIRVDLTEDFSAFKGVIICEVYWNNDSLKVKALLNGVNGSILEIAQPYRIAV